MVRIVIIDNDQHIEVYTLGTNKWRIKKTRSYYMHRSTKVSVYGALHWVAKTQRPQKAGLHPIVSLGLLDEKSIEFLVQIVVLILNVNLN